MARIKLTLSRLTSLIPLRQNPRGAEGKAVEHGAAVGPPQVLAVARGVNQALPIEVLRPQLHGAGPARTQAPGEPVLVPLRVGEARQHNKMGGIRSQRSDI